MANANTFQGRIAHKIDTAENWSKATGFKPLPGEFVLYDKDDEHDYIRAKIGDGENFVTDLPFADASIWAELAQKQPLGDYATKDYVDSGDEIPFFDLVEMGLPTATIDGAAVSISLTGDTLTSFTNAIFAGKIQVSFKMLLPNGTDSGYMQYVNPAINRCGKAYGSFTRVILFGETSHPTNREYRISFMPNGSLSLQVFSKFSQAKIDDAIGAITPDSIGAQPAGDYLTAVPDEYVTDSELTAKGYATETYVQNLIETSLVEGAW